MPPQSDDAVIKVRDLVVDFASRRVLNGVHLDLKRGEILGFVGASGAGKSVLTRTVVGLLPMQSGSIEVLGVELSKANQAERQAVDRRWGVLFQQGALFSSLTSGSSPTSIAIIHPNCRAA
jgi:phospholipid/cholesterol/gamma-HCH transport system ATP-binding protein